MFNIMVMNKDISSIVLLVVIGFVIYCLSNNDTKKPEKQIEITTESSIQSAPVKETFANQSLPQCLQIIYLKFQKILKFLVIF